MKYLLYIIICIIGFLTSCSQRKAEMSDWYQPLTDLMSEREQLLQTNPDSMKQLIAHYPSDADSALVGQWKNLLIAKCCFMKGEDAECIKRIKQAWHYAQQHEGHPAALKIMSYADNLYGILMLNTVRRPEALRYFERAYYSLMQLSSHDDAIDICINAADVCRQMGQLANSSSWYRRANFLADSLHIDKAQNCILAGLGQVYNDMQNYQLAHYYFAKAERQYPPQNVKDIHFFYNSWGNVYSSEGKPAKALECFLKAQRACNSLKQPFMAAIVEANLGQTYMELHKLDSAQKYLDRTTRFFLAKPDMQSDLQFYVDGLNASLAMEKGDLHEARAILSKPYVLSCMSPNYIYLHHRILANLYEKTGDYASALGYRKLMEQYDDSLRNAKMLSMVGDNELRFKQDTAIIRRDLSLSAAKVEANSNRTIFLLVTVALCLGILALIVYMRYKTLRAEHLHQEEMKRMLALKMENVRNRFSPHFVFNVLNVFVSSLPSDVNVKPLRLLIQVLRANLLTCDKLAVSLDEEMEMVTHYSYLRHETNQLLPMPEFDIADDVDRSMLLPSMIVQIPVENALKHAFGDGDNGGRKPELWVKIRQREGMLHIQIKDNGCGLVRNNAAKRSSNAAVSTGTGLRILHSTIDMLNANNVQQILFLVSSSSDGTLVDIKVPCQYKYKIS